MLLTIVLQDNVSVFIERFWLFNCRFTYHFIQIAGVHVWCIWLTIFNEAVVDDRHWTKNKQQYFPRHAKFNSWNCSWIHLCYLNTNVCHLTGFCLSRIIYKTFIDQKLSQKAFFRSDIERGTMWYPHDLLTKNDFLSALYNVYASHIPDKCRNLNIRSTAISSIHRHLNKDTAFSQLCTLISNPNQIYSVIDVVIV